MQTLIIYDSVGRIWNITYGQYELPNGLTAAIMDVPEGSQIQSVDVSDGEPKLVFADLPENDIRVLKAGIQAINDTMKPFATAMSITAEKFTDEQALTVPTLYPTWNGGAQKYKVGKRVNRDGVLYKVLQDHVSQMGWEPENAPSLLYTLIILHGVEFSE